MRSLNSTEVGGLILSGVLVIGGLFMVLLPREGVVQHQANLPHGTSDGYLEIMTKGKSRLYGCAAIVVGGVLAFAVWYREK